MKRADLIKALDRLKIETGSIVCLGCGYEHNCCTQGCALIRAAVEELSAADVRPVVRGHDTGKSRWFQCSVCRYGVNDLFEACENGMPSCYERKGDTGWNFCPNCGADMREARD